MEKELEYAMPGAVQTNTIAQNSSTREWNALFYIKCVAKRDGVSEKEEKK